MSDLRSDITADEVCRALNLMHAFEAISVGWDVSAAAAVDETPHFLQSEYVAQTCRDLRMSDDVSRAIAQAAERITSDRHLVRLAWHAYWMAFEADPPRGPISQWPSLKGIVEAPGDLFYVVVSLGAYPKLRAAHARRRIPGKIVNLTLDRFVRAIETYHAKHGEYGLGVPSFNYLRLMFAGELYQVGRLQFHYNPFRGRLKVYRRSSDRATVALSEPGIVYRRDGELYLESRGDTSDGVWTSSWNETDESVTAHPIRPFGKGLPEPITLSKKEWECVLGPGDAVLQIHIPGGSPMDFAACGRSLEEAERFFGEYFPEHGFKAFACDSWLLDIQLEVMLPERSNLVRFLQEFYRFPTRGTTQSALRWIFGEPPEDLTKAPKDTTLRRKVIEHVLGGGGMVGGGGFVLLDGLDWGSKAYRCQDLGGVVAAG